MRFFEKYLEIQDLPPKQYKATKVYSIISLCQTFAFALVDTFLVLYLLDFLSFTELGIALAIRYGITAVLDFPTGALGDYIGQARVLRIAYSFLGTGTLILVFSTNLPGVVFAFIFLAMGESQLSGALETWLDNEYKDEKVDPEKKIYGSFRGRLRGIGILINGITYIISGTVAILLGRRILVFLHFISIMSVFLFIFILIPVKKELSQQELQDLIPNTLRVMRTSLNWFLKEKEIFTLFLGSGLIFGVGLSVWYNQMLFPFYFAYSGDDFYTGVIRSANFIVGFLWVLIVPSISKRVVNEKLPYLFSNFYANGFFFFICWIYYVLVPPTYTFLIGPFIGIIVLFQAVSVGDVLTEVFLSRILIKSVPEDIRNSIYSLFSTTITFFAVPIAPIGGWVIDNYGFANGILFVTILSIIGLMIIGYGFLKYDQVSNIPSQVID